MKCRTHARALSPTLAHRKSEDEIKQGKRGRTWEQWIWKEKIWERNTEFKKASYSSGLPSIELVTPQSSGWIFLPYSNTYYNSFTAPRGELNIMLDEALRGRMHACYSQDLEYSIESIPQIIIYLYENTTRALKQIKVSFWVFCHKGNIVLLISC